MTGVMVALGHSYFKQIAGGNGGFGPAKVLGNEFPRNDPDDRQLPGG